MAASLKFGKATSNEGFTPHSTASFSDLRPARIVRELIQNSLDAAVVEAGEDTAIMRFQVEPITRREVPDVRGYEAAFKRAVKFQTKVSDGQLPDAAQQVVDHIRAGLTNLNSGNASVLSVLDNGIGLDSKRMNSLLGDGFQFQVGRLLRLLWRWTSCAHGTLRPQIHVLRRRDLEWRAPCRRTNRFGKPLHTAKTKRRPRVSGERFQKRA